MRTEYRNDPAMDPSGFVVLADYVPHIIQEIRYYSTYNFIGERIDGYEEPCALLSIEAARALKSAASELIVQGYRLKVFDAYRPACAVKHFVLWGLESDHLDQILANCTFDHKTFLVEDGTIHLKEESQDV